MSDKPFCPLCQHTGPTQTVQGNDQRQYHHCQHCQLIFADPAHRLALADEAAYYGTHHNGIDNTGYVRFLNQLLQPMLPYLNPGMRGLDYGCGPGPTLSQMARQAGLSCEDYDPIFFKQAPQPPYDFIFSSECFEHFHRPHQEIERICKLLKPQGLLGIMTEHWQSLAQFARWHYTRDPTHTVFYHAQSLAFICRHFGLEPLWQDHQRVAILRRTPGCHLDML